MRLGGLLFLTCQNLIIVRPSAAGVLVFNRQLGFESNLLAVLKYSHLSRFDFYFLSFFETITFSTTGGAVFNLLYLFIDNLHTELVGL